MEAKKIPNTAHITNNYDSFARLTETTLRNGSTLAELNRHEYIYNNGHQRTKQTRKDDDYVDYLYDDAGQLYSAKTYDSGHIETTTQRRGYTYDPAWNLTKTTNNATVSTRTVNNLNQVTGVTGGYTLTHDANGNRTASSANYSVYVYDDENQLIEWYNDPAWYSGAKKTQFTYDGKGRLRLQIESTYVGNQQGGPGSISSDTRYIYAGMLVIQERNISNVPQVSYTRGWDLSASLEGAGGIGGLLARSHAYSAGSWSTHNFYHADSNGNITMMLDSTRASVATYKYDPYGNSFTASGTLAAANLYRFSSKLFMTNSTIYYYGYRFYDPTLQRWLNHDPIQEKGGINLYAFVNNSGINLIDLWGLEPMCGCNDSNGNPKQGSDVAKICCKGSAPKAPDNSKQYNYTDTYMLIRAQPMYENGGNNEWGNIVRGCLLCMVKHGAGMHEAHMFCYGEASDRTTTCQTVWGYTAALSAATCTFFGQAFDNRPLKGEQ